MAAVDEKQVGGKRKQKKIKDFESKMIWRGGGGKIRIVELVGVDVQISSLAAV